jgi:SAM-dependent methyltransferase
LALAEGGAGKVTGLDIQPRFCFAAKEAERRGLGQLRFLQGSTEVLPDKAFDVVLSHDSFEHFADPAHIFSEMVRVTRPGGALLIKFGLPWRNPWGRHMAGTVRADRPWVHLMVSERTLMRCHSAYHNQPRLFERFENLPGGLNRMTLGRFKRILKRPDVKLTQFKVTPIFSLKIVTLLPSIREFFAAEVTARCFKAA